MPRLLLSESEVVVHVHRDTGGFVGIDAATRAKYGLVGPGQIACRMQLKETVIGPKLEGDTLEFSFTRAAGYERCFVEQGDYLLFLKRDPRHRWALVADYLGLQLFTPGLDTLVKELKANDGL